MFKQHPDHAQKKVLKTALITTLSTIFDTKVFTDSKTTEYNEKIRNHITIVIQQH